MRKLLFTLTSIVVFSCSGTPEQGEQGIQGPVGPAGPTGPQGPQGPAGADGSPGLAGAEGPAGAQGPVGPSGAQGAAGAQGPIGPQGPAGAQGPLGAQGPAGVQGPAGAPAVLTIAPLDAGVPPCAFGGARFTSGDAGVVLCNGATGATGSTGAAGATGATGATGAQGAPGLSGYERVVNRVAPDTLGPNGEVVRFANCPPGKKVLGGGYLVFGATGRWLASSSGPSSDTQWAAAIANTTGVTINAAVVEVWAICAVTN